MYQTILHVQREMRSMVQSTGYRLQSTGYNESSNFSEFQWVSVHDTCSQHLVFVALACYHHIEEEDEEAVNGKSSDSNPSFKDDEGDFDDLVETDL